ncbi:MAG: acyl-CoA carboxylase subunit epsilon [Actinomycetota bacterium]|nr:acyl-CoA carboxylase subunit epsilon [Actinomycetota bacterium]
MTEPGLIVTSDATEEEVAALVVALATIAEMPTPAAVPRQWTARHRTQRRSLPHGPGGWRASRLPR